MPRLVEFFRQRPDFRFRELAHGLLQQLLFFRQFQVHGGSLPSGQTAVRIAHCNATPVVLRPNRRERSASEGGPYKSLFSRQASAFDRRSYVVFKSSWFTRVSPLAVLNFE